ncbi:MAG: ATP-binding cassette domain-containing protein [Candidatus Omnitrophica bacterium]|nr:ATP-binding cassette domain-containing protein [Candidatus Omnitrophota bacterium]
MITITNLSKQYGKRILYSNLSLSVNPGEKIGLIGPNGAGKSTLFHLILGEMEPSAGDVHVLKGVRIGYLPQESSFKSEHTVLSELIEGDETIMRLKKDKAALEEKNEAGSARYGEVLHELESLGYFELEHKAKQVLAGLGFKERDFARPVQQMSGGWQMRTLLGKLLTCHYDLLLLDEPTNYLDLNAAIWLKDYLSGFRGTFIMISHDKAFLNDVTNYTLILENGAIAKVHGNYEHYERMKAERRLHLTRQFKEQEKKREQLQRFVDRFHAQPNKASSVRAKRTALEKMEEIIVPPDPRESIRDFKFPATRESGYRIINLEKIGKSYGDIKVYEDFDFEVSKGDKAVLVGENGAGKSTLLKILAGVVGIDKGARVVGHNVDIGYFSQTRVDVLNMENTVLKEAYSAAPGYMGESVVRTILAAFLFTGEDADKRVSVLSGGEKSRLILAKLLINPPNFLLLDEPTTHLDVDAVDALLKALKEYTGTIVFISHDIYFVRSLANVVYEVKDGRVRKYPDDFDYYLYKKSQGGGFTDEVRKKPAVDPDQQKRKDDQSRKREEERLRRQDEQRRKKHNSDIRLSINKLEKDKERLDLERLVKLRALSDTRIYRDEDQVRAYGRRLKEIEKILGDIDAKIKRFEEEIKG